MSQWLTRRVLPPRQGHSAEGEVGYTGFLAEKLSPRNIPTTFACVSTRRVVTMTAQMKSGLWRGQRELFLHPSQS